MSTKLNFGRDVQGYNAYAPIPSTNIFTAKLVANTAETITLPTNVSYWIVAFSYTGGSEVWVDFTGATAAAPTLATFGSSTSSRAPGTRTISSTKTDPNTGLTVATTISLLTTDVNAYVSVELWGCGLNVSQ
jgi:hypothetical protein